MTTSTEGPATEQHGGNVKMTFEVWLWVRRLQLIRWLRRNLGIDNDTHQAGMHAHMQTQLIKGVRADQSAMLIAHQKLREEFDRLDRRLKYYSLHNDSLRHTAKRFDRMIAAEEEMKAKEFRPKPEAPAPVEEAKP